MIKKLKTLREQHPSLVYQSFNWEIKNKNLECSFKFLLQPDICFEPKLLIKNLKREELLKINHNTIAGLVFNLGMIELVSYWKATLSSEIIIKAGHLNKIQAKWWKQLFMEGLGEFFYRNQIDRKDVTLKFTVQSTESYVPYRDEVLDENKILLPIGGGKDSIVSLEIIKNQKVKNQNNILFSLNPTQATLDILKANSDLQAIIVEREIDPQLLKLNQKGYFNGHTPFSAYLAFLSSLVATSQGIQNVAVSNEKSADEATVEIKGEKFNHQYSKTTDFEKRFRDYCKKFLVSNLEYFSILRPLHEIQIAKIFSQVGEKYFSMFRSCNRGQKTNVWCHDCPKCLFAFLILFPFIDEEILCKKIFNSNLFEKKSLLDDALKLVQLGEVKPWECVGTREESLIAFYLSVKKYQESKKKLPIILKEIEKQVLKKEKDLDKRAKKLLSSWSKTNFVPENIINLIKLKSHT